MTFAEPVQFSVEDLRRYLQRHGWRQITHPNPRIAYYSTEANTEGNFASLILPVSESFSDARERSFDALRSLAEYERRPLEEMARRLHLWDKDILRASVVARGESSRSLPLSVAAEAITGFRELISYAAYTETNPKPFFDRAGPIGKTFAQNCLFGHTFEGSFGFNIECPLTLIPNLPLTGIEPEIPFEREILQRIAIGFSDLRTAIQTDDVDPIVHNYQLGFSANMCQTLDEIYEKIDGRRIEYDFIWCPEVSTEIVSRWKPFTFEGKAYEISKEAARKLQKVEQYPDALIQGRIVQLKSEVPPSLDEQGEFERTITMFWEREKASWLKIRVPLSPSDYQRACDAHKEGKRIRIFGIPEKSGKYWLLTRVHDFAVL